MSRSINLRGVTYAYPDSTDTEWGATASDYASAVGDAIRSIVPSTDIVDTVVSGLVEDNTVRAIPFLIIDPLKLIGATAQITVLRAGGSSTEYATFTMCFIRSGSTWSVSTTGIGSTAVVLTINDVTGQMYFQAASLGSTTFKIRFRVAGIAL